LLQSFEGIGPAAAEGIYDHFEGVPLEWSVTPEELQEIDGIGPKTAEKLMDSL
jgi:ERCC4-type nuclease